MFRLFLKEYTESERTTHLLGIVREAANSPESEEHRTKGHMLLTKCVFKLLLKDSQRAITSPWN